MTTLHWKNAVSGSFNVAANWNPATVPGAADSVFLDPTGTYTVSSAVNNTVFSLSTIATATLSITGNAFTLTHDSDNVGTIAVANGASLVTGAAGSAIGLFNSGSIKLSATSAATKWQIAATKLSLSGAGKVLLNAKATNAIVSAGSAATLDNVDNTISGAGTIGDTHLTLVNESAGVINANNSVMLVINTGTNAVANAGVIETTSTGGLQINSNFTNNGSLVAGGAGALTISGATITGGGTISTTVASAHIDLVNANIVFDGTISTVAGSKISTLAATIDRLDAHNFNNAGSVVIADNSALQMGGVVNNTGTVAINAGADATALEIDTGYLRLTGGGQVTLADSLQSFIVSNGSTSILDNRGNTISGAGTIGDGNVRLANRSGSLINANGTHALTINGTVGTDPNFNGGVIETTGSGGLTITGALVNTGTLKAIGSGGLLLSGAAVSFGAVQTTASGAHIDLQNAGIIGATTSLVAGSTLNALANTTDSIGGTVKNAGNVVVADKATFNALSNTYFVNSGTFSLNASTGPTKLVISARERVLGNGNFTLSDNSNNLIVSDGAPAGLLNFGNTITGAGTIGDGNLQFQNLASGVVNANGNNSLIIADYVDPNLSDLNTGLMETTGAGGLKILTFIRNEGTMNAVGSGGLLVGNTIFNDGAIGAVASGAHIDLQSANINGGIVSTVAGSSINSIASTTNNLDVFDFENAGSLVVNDKSFLNIGSFVDNTGTISLNAATGITTLAVDAFDTGTTGGGALTLSDNVNNRIVSNRALTNATTTATIGGTEKNGDVISLTFTNANLSGFPVTISLTTAGNQSLASIAAGLTSAVNANAKLLAAGIHASATGAVITLQQPGDVGNKTSVSSTLSSGATETVGFSSSQLQGGASPTFNNDDNIITGAGTIGDANLVFNNATNGVINANGTKALTFNSASNDDFNGGLMEVTKTGGLTVMGALTNTGTLAAAGTGALLLKNALINNGGGFVSATVSGAHVDLNNASILLGDVSTVVGSKIDTIAGTTNVMTAAASNAGVIVVTNNSSLVMADIVNNTGTISIAGAANATTLKVDAAGLFLQGHGRLTLTNAATNAIKSNGAPALLRNYDNLIAGGGTIGDANLTLQNQAGGIIDANGTVALTINTGANVVANAGTLESAAAGGLTVTGALANDGILLAAAGTLKVTGAVTGNGVTKISGAGMVEFGGASNQNVTFTAGSSGTLRLDTSSTAAYTGTVSGLATTNALDFSDVAFGGGTVATFAGTSTHGVLTVTDGSHVSHVKLQGNFLSSTFTTSSDGHGGTKVVDPPAGAPHAMMAAAGGHPAQSGFVVEPSMLANAFAGPSGPAAAPQYASGFADLVHSLHTHDGIAHEPLPNTTPGHFDSFAGLASSKGEFAFHG